MKKYTNELKLDGNEIDFLESFVKLCRKYFSFEKNIDFLLQLFDELESDYPLMQQFRNHWYKIFQQATHIGLMTESGIPSQTGFYQELRRRIGDFILPSLVNIKESSGIIDSLLEKKKDKQWIDSLSVEVLTRFIKVLNLPKSDYPHIFEPFWISFKDSLHILAIRIASIFQEPLFLEKLRDLQISRSISSDLVKASFLNSQDYESFRIECLNKIQEISQAVQIIKNQQAVSGVSVSLVYNLLRVERLLERMNDLLLFLDKSIDHTEHALNFSKTLIQSELSRHGIAGLFSESTENLAYQVTQHNSDTGKHYIANNKKEFISHLKAAIGGGIVVIFTTFNKFFIKHLHKAPLVETFLFSLNYAGSFILIYTAHFSLATKQPAMTASALASSLDYNNKQVELSKTVELIIKLIRSQFASFFGNLIAVIPGSFLFAMIYFHLTGDLIVEHEEVEGVLKSNHPLYSNSVIYAGFAGCFLFLSGLITGYYENKIDYHKIPERVKEHKFLKKVINLKWRTKIAVYIDQHYGGLMGNLILGFFLGTAGFIGFLTGLPFDIRHITISSGSFGFAWYTSYSYITKVDLAWAFLGLFLIGLMNFSVSFGLALFTALKSRRISVVNTKTIIFLVGKRILKRPWEIFWPQD
ncbi:MAG: hypothetical protein SNJ77_05240 [Cytophagales bacterium]